LKNKKPYLAFIPISLFLVLWELAAGFKLIKPSLFPPPSKIISKLVALSADGLPVSSTLGAHIAATLERLAVAFIIGSVIGILVGLFMGLNKPAFKFFNPLISVLMPIPGIALAPIFIIWFGFGDATIIPLGALSAFFPMVYSTISGVRSIDRKLVNAAEIMGANRRKIILSVYLPWAASYVFNGTKLGLARAWMTVVAVEFIAATNWGLGYMIWNATEYLRSDTVYVGILVLIIIYFLLEKLFINTIEKRTIVRWGMVGDL